MDTPSLPSASHRMTLTEITATAWILCRPGRGLRAPIWGYAAPAGLSWWPSPDRSAPSCFSSIRRSCLTCIVPATSGSDRCQEGSRIVSAASAGLRERLSERGLHGGRLYHCRIWARHPRHYCQAGRAGSGHAGLDLSPSMFAPWLLGCPGTPRQHPVPAVRRGFRRTDNMAAPGTCRHRLTPGRSRRIGKTADS